MGFTLTGNPSLGLWIANACFSGLLVVIKNIFYIPKGSRIKVSIYDIGIIALFTAMLLGIPDYWGLIKCLITAVVGGSCAGLMSWKICSG